MFPSGSPKFSRWRIAELGSHVCRPLAVSACLCVNSTNEEGGVSAQDPRIPHIAKTHRMEPSEKNIPCLLKHLHSLPSALLSACLKLGAGYMNFLLQSLQLTQSVAPAPSPKQEMLLIACPGLRKGFIYI